MGCWWLFVSVCYLVLLVWVCGSGLVLIVLFLLLSLLVLPVGLIVVLAVLLGFEWFAIWLCLVGLFYFAFLV